MRSSLHLPLLLGVLGCAGLAAAQAPWLGFGGGSEHHSQSNVASLKLDKIIWSTPVDLFPPYSGDHLLIHYGSPMITPANTIVVPVKTGPDTGFQVSGFRGSNGKRIWNALSTYTMPPHGWVPSFNPTLLPPLPGSNTYRVAWPESAGRITIRSDADAKTSPHTTVAFYGMDAYRSRIKVYTSNVKISTPLTAGPDGSVYFGYVVLGDTPIHLQSGLAKIDRDGNGSFVTAATLGADPELAYIKAQSAPAVSADGSVLYTVVANGNFGRGKLVRVDTATMQPISRADLKDPRTGNDAAVDFDGTASPVIGPNGDVFVGVLENPFPSNHYRGWLLHFSGDLATQKTPGAFGWDNTASIIPSEIVPFYHGSSPYLLFTKYNNYADSGDPTSGNNRIAILDPFDHRTDPVSGVETMKVIAAKLGPTHDPRFSGDERMEWCISVGVVDIPGKCLLANSEDGMVYRWDLVKNRLTESLRITPGLGQAYTVTLIGPDGKVYAINNATLFAIGSKPRS